MLNLRTNPAILTKILSTQLMLRHAKALAERSLNCPIQLTTVANDTINLLKQMGLSHRNTNLPQGFDSLLANITETKTLGNPIQKPASLPDAVIERWTTLLRNSLVFSNAHIPKPTNPHNPTSHPTHSLGEFHQSIFIHFVVNLNSFCCNLQFSQLRYITPTNSHLESPEIVNL